MTFDRERYKQFASQQIAGRRKNATLAVLVVLIITLLFSIPETRLNYTWNDMLTAAQSSFTELTNYLSTNNGTTPLKTALSIIETIVSFIVQIALASFFLAYSRSPAPVSLKVLFEGFNKWGRGILTGLWQLLWYAIWICVIAIIGVIIMIPLYLIFPNAMENYDNVYNFTLLIVIACLIFIIIKAIEYSHHFYLVAEYPELGIRKALRISILITKGHRADIFITHLTFLGYYFLSVITLGLAQLWYRPYTDMTFINIYHALLKDALETGKIHPEDLN